MAGVVEFDSAMKNTFVILVLAALSIPAYSQGARAVSAQSVSTEEVTAQITDSATVHFRQNISVLDTALFNNGSNLSSFIKQNERIKKNPDLTLKKINIFGAASPEGPVMLNRNLSERRAQAIYNYVSARTAMPDSLVSFRYMGRDWKGLQHSVEADSNVPDREEVMALLNEIVATATPTTAGDAEAIERLQHIGNGAPYSYLYSQLYPALRESGIEMQYAYTPHITLTGPEVMIITPEAEIENIMVWGEAKSCKPFYMGLKTNLLYDALALPNIGAEFYLGKNISIVGNWMYGWWDKDSSHRYWRAYGGDLAVRWWFGPQAHAKPLTGHHLGVYGGIVTYDFEFGGKGYMGGLPGETLWNRCNRFAGVEYGYSLPVARRLNIDFTIGVGYFGGKYIKYVPDHGHYEWQSTHKLTWFGPTKAEVSLVWLIGCNNYNRKGGAR